MLYGRRKRLRSQAESEADGASFWTDDLDGPGRYKLLYAIRSLIESTGDTFGKFNLLTGSRQTVLENDGIPSLAGSSDPSDDTAKCVLNGDMDIVLSVIESILSGAKFATSDVFSDVAQSDQVKWTNRLPTFRREIGTVLLEHRVRVSLIDDRFTDFESLEMHGSVVSPAMTLLGGRTDLAAVEKSYRDALDEIHDGKPEDAVTDAGTALQEMLVSLGCQGNSLGRLINDAKNKGLLGPHDSKLTASIENAMQWVSADRSNTGDGHNAADAMREDAWLIVHIVGALILRLAHDTPRQPPSS